MARGVTGSTRDFDSHGSGSNPGGPAMTSVRANSTRRPLAVVVLAAGQGTRFRSAIPKVLHTLLGRPMLEWVLEAASPLKASKTVVVIGNGAEQVKETLGKRDGLAFAMQKERKGTAHALKAGLKALKAFDGDLLVLCGDTPLVTAAQLSKLLVAHRKSRAVCTVLSAVLDDPTGYGRVLRHPSGEVTRIVEQKDANETELALQEVNSGIYVIDVASARTALRKVRANNAQGEEYLTDVVEVFASDGQAVRALPGDASCLVGVNDRWQLAQAEMDLQERINRAHAEAGVTLVDPTSIRIGPDVKLGIDAVIGPDVSISGNSSVGSGSRIQRAVLIDATVGKDCEVGPFAYLRPGAKLGNRSKVGTYVEVKGSSLGEGSKVPHLSYVGDAIIGRDVNVGAATVTVNYDSETKIKAQTRIKDGAKIGSDTMLIAPVTVGRNSVTGAGSVVTRDVPDGTVVVGNPARQIRKSKIGSKKSTVRGNAKGASSK